MNIELILEECGILKVRPRSLSKPNVAKKDLKEPESLMANTESAYYE